MIEALAAELLRNDPDASLWDFLCLWYEYLHGNFPVTETDEEVVKIVYFHLSGLSPTVISKTLDINQGNVVAYLKSMGFRPWTSKHQGMPTVKIYEDWVHTQDVKLICENYKITKHTFNKIVDEFENAKRVLDYAS